MDKKRLLSLLLASSMTVSLISGNASAALKDTQGNWAEDSIIRWNEAGVLNGDQNGNFNPGRQMTRAQFATMLVNLLGYTEKAPNTFADVQEGAWYADAMLKLAAAGVMQGDGLYAKPNAPITRQAAAAMLCRALDLQPATDLGNTFQDVPAGSWAAPYIAALYQRGMIQGYDGSHFAPTRQITRAAVAKILDNMVITYVTEDGAVITGKQEGIVIIAAKNVTIKDAELSENLFLAPSSAGGETRLENVTGGKVIVAGRGGILKTDRKTVLKDVTVTAPQTELAVSGKVEKLRIDEKAENTKVDAAKGAEIGRLESDADNVQVDGRGTVKDMTVTGGENVSVGKEITVDKVTNKGESPLEVGGQTVEPGAEVKPYEPSGGGSNTPAPAPKTVEAATAEELNELLKNAGRWDDLTVTITKKITGEILADSFQGAGLTLDFGSTGSALTSLSLNAPNAAKILLQDDAASGSLVTRLTLDAPSATKADCALEVTGDASIQIAGSGTFTAQDTLGGTVKMLRGGLKMTEGGSITVPQDATGPVSLDVAEKVVNIETTQPVKMISAGKVNIKAANAKVEIMRDHTLAEVEIANTAAGAALTGGAVKKVTVYATATVSCEAFMSQEGTNQPDPCVIVPAEAKDNLQLTLDMSAARKSFQVDIQKAGITVNGRNNTADIIVHADSITVNGTAKELTLTQKSSTANVNGTVEMIKVESAAARSVITGSGKAASFWINADCTVNLPVGTLTLAKFTGESQKTIPSTVTIQKKVGIVNFAERVTTATLTLEKNSSIGSIVSGDGVGFPIHTLTLSGSGTVEKVESYNEKDNDLTITINDDIRVTHVYKLGEGTVSYSPDSPVKNPEVAKRKVTSIAFSNVGTRTYRPGSDGKEAFVGIGITPTYDDGEKGDTITLTEENVGNLVQVPTPDQMTEGPNDKFAVIYGGFPALFPSNTVIVVLDRSQLNRAIDAAKANLQRLESKELVEPKTDPDQPDKPLQDALDQAYTNQGLVPLGTKQGLIDAIGLGESCKTQADINDVTGKLANLNTDCNNAAGRRGTLKTDTQVLTEALTSVENKLKTALSADNRSDFNQDIEVETNTTEGIGKHIVTVTWVSDSSAITVDADSKILTVTQGVEDQPVTLTATVRFTNGEGQEATATKTFPATVAKAS